MQPDYKIMLKQLKKELHAKDEGDFILELFEKRLEELQSYIMKDEEYNENSRKILKIRNEIEEKYSNNEILNAFEKHSSLVYFSNYLYEKLMYKCGVMDGMRLVIDGLKKIDMESI